MKKLALFLIALCLLSSCEKDNETTDHPKKTYDIKYNGNDIVNIVLREERDLNVSSDYQLYYYSDNEGHIFCKITCDAKEEKEVLLKKGSAFIQGIFLEYGITFDDEVTETRNGGFGSTNK